MSPNGSSSWNSFESHRAFRKWRKQVTRERTLKGCKLSCFQPTSLISWPAKMWGSQPHTLYPAVDAVDAAPPITTDAAGPASTIDWSAPWSDLSRSKNWDPSEARGQKKGFPLGDAPSRYFVTEARQVANTENGTRSGVTDVVNMTGGGSLYKWCAGLWKCLWMEAREALECYGRAQEEKCKCWKWYVFKRLELLGRKKQSSSVKSRGEDGRKNTPEIRKIDPVFHWSLYA